jgi:hypothetical protein
MKQLDLTRFLSILFVALTLAASGAHLLELPNKMALQADDYLTVQQIYRGWELLGFVILGAVLATAAHVVVLRLRRQPWVFAAMGLACCSQDRPFSGASPSRPTRKRATGPCCRTIGHVCVHNGSIRMRQARL